MVPLQISTLEEFSSSPVLIEIATRNRFSHPAERVLLERDRLIARRNLYNRVVKLLWTKEVLLRAAIEIVLF